MVTSQDFMTIDILAEISSEQNKLKALVKQKLNREVDIAQLDLSAGVYTIPFPPLINTIERNIDSFTALGYTSDEMEKTVLWKGELNDRVRFSYKDVNRWFKSCDILTAITHSAADWAVITGNFTSGNNRIRQIIRTVN